MGGLVTVPDIDSALTDYRDRLGLRLVDESVVGEALAASWNCPGNAGSRMATLQPSSASSCSLTSSTP